MRWSQQVLDHCDRNVSDRAASKSFPSLQVTHPLQTSMEFPKGVCGIGRGIGFRDIAPCSEPF